jgi:hypothetical protein
VGVNSDTLQVLKVSNGDYCVKLHIKCKNDGFEWIFVPVYGAAQEMHKSDFLAELVRTCEHEPLPMLVGGISILLGKKRKKIMIISMPAGPLFLMLSLSISI